MRLSVSIAVTGLFWATGTAVLAQNSPQSASPDAVQQITACRSITEPMQRLACFDAAVGALDSARTGGDLVVVSRSEVQANQRSAFGFNINLVNPFARQGAPVEEIEAIQSPVRRARQMASGRWLVSLEDGSTWMQIDDTSVNVSRPEDATATVRRAVLGSYLMTIGSSRAFRVRRQND
jgi:Protein of unknown function (DUF3121).